MHCVCNVFSSLILVVALTFKTNKIHIEVLLHFISNGHTFSMYILPIENKPIPCHLSFKMKRKKPQRRCDCVKRTRSRTIYCVRSLINDHLHHDRHEVY